MEKPFIDAARCITEKPYLFKSPMHTHDIYEIYCFISGNAKYSVEGNLYNLRSGDILIMKKAEVHSLIINGDVPYERIVINFNSDAILPEVKTKITEFLDSRPIGINNRYPASMFKESPWLYYLDKICNLKEVNEKRIYLTALLSELCEGYPKISNQKIVSEGISEIINYINNHITEDLNLDKICNRFYISKPHINRRFKQIIGTTVWEYITTKRLLLAKELLQNGEHPTEVYSKCGFNDYCTFFRAYKMKFNISPRETVRKI